MSGDPKNLLALQAVDTALDQLERRLATLPERAEHNEITAAITQLRAVDAADAESEAALAADQKRLEDEVSGIRAKIEAESARASQLTSPRELQGIEAELASLNRRAADLDDRTLELMEEIEPISERRSVRNEEITELTARSDSVGAALAVAESELRDAIAARQAERGDVVKTVDPAHLGRYDDLRSHMGGIVVGELDGDRCTACSLTLPPVEAERVRDEPPGSVVPCECGALIVR